MTTREGSRMRLDGLSYRHLAIPCEAEGPPGPGASEDA